MEGGGCGFHFAMTLTWEQIVQDDSRYNFLQGRFYLKNRQKPTATLIYTDNIIYNIYTTYIPPPPIINTFSDVKIHVSKVHVHQNSKR